MNTYFNGFGDNTVTFEATDEVYAGALVKISDSNTVSVAAEDEVFCGVCVNVRSGFAAVQICGYTEAEGSDVTTGYVKLACDGAGGVKVSENGREYLVVSVCGNKIGFIL